MWRQIGIIYRMLKIWNESLYCNTTTRYPTAKAREVCMFIELIEAEASKVNVDTCGMCRINEALRVSKFVIKLYREQEDKSGSCF